MQWKRFRTSDASCILILRKIHICLYRRVKKRFQDALSKADSSIDLDADPILPKPTLPSETNLAVSYKISITIRPYSQQHLQLRPLKFMMMTTHTFKKMMEVYCIRQNIPFDQLVLTYKGALVFHFSTPLALDIGDGDELRKLGWFPNG